MSELTPEQTLELFNKTSSVRNEIIDIVKRDDVSLNVGVLAVVSLAEEIRGKLSEEDRLQTDRAARSFNALSVIERVEQMVRVAGEN